MLRKAHVSTDKRNLMCACACTRTGVYPPLQALLLNAAFQENKVAGLLGASRGRCKTGGHSAATVRWHQGNTSEEIPCEK